MKRAAIAWALGACAIACASGGTRDLVPETSDTLGGATASTAQGSYAHVAKRSLGFVALSQVSGVDAEDAARAVDRLADSMDACAADLAKKGKLVDGAIRVVANVKPDGAIVAGHLTIAPGDAVAANALLCVVAPLKMTALAPANDASKARGFAIDASWGPPSPTPTPPPRAP